MPRIRRRSLLLAAAATPVAAAVPAHAASRTGPLVIGHRGAAG